MFGLICQIRTRAAAAIIATLYLTVGTAGQQSPSLQQIESLRALEESSRLTPALALQLGRSYAHLGADLAAAAWFQCYLALAPNAPDGLDNYQRLQRVRALARFKLDRIIIDGQTVARAAGDEITSRQFAMLRAQAAVAVGDVQEAVAALAFLPTVDDQDIAWKQVVRGLVAAGHFTRAEQAASQIADSGGRDVALKVIVSLRGAPALSEFGSLTQVEQWRALARDFSARPQVTMLATEIKQVRDLPGDSASRRLLDLARALTNDYLRLLRLEEEFNTS